MLSLSFNSQAASSNVLNPSQQEQVANGLEHDAQIMSNTYLQQQISGQQADVQADIIGINTKARHVALQTALLIPLLAGTLGLINSLRMLRQPEPKPSGSADITALG